MVTSSTDPPKKLWPIKPSRRLTREIPMNRDDDYHGGVSVSVPFRWESEPGAPIIRFRESPLPPLTPPPSYYSGTLKCPDRKKPNKSNLLGTIFPKRTTRKTNLPSTPASFSSSSSSSSSEISPWSASYSVPSTPMRPSNFRGRYDCREREEEEDLGGVSSLCFARSRGRCYSSLIKILFRDSQ